MLPDPCIDRTVCHVTNPRVCMVTRDYKESVTNVTWHNHWYRSVSNDMVYNVRTCIYILNILYGFLFVPKVSIAYHQTLAGGVPSWREQLC